MNLYTSVLRPLLFRLPPDQSHDLARFALRWPLVWRALGAFARFADPRLETDLGGLTVPNPVGLAPGFDKNADLLPGLGELGFGFIAVGSITREPRWGNPFPRLVRYPERLSIANSMGLPNRGVEQAIRKLSRPRNRSCPVIAVLSGSSSDELFQLAAEVEPHVDAIEVGLGCPNTTDEERIEGMRQFTILVEGLAARATKPVFVKLPPHYTDQERQQVLTMADVCVQAGVAGLALSGSRRVVEPRLGMGNGSLAGKDTFADALRILSDVAQRAAGRLSIRVSGGVFTGDDAYQMLRAGAAAVEVYSAFIYRGWDVAGRINRELAAILTDERISSIDELKNAMPAATTGPAKASTAAPVPKPAPTASAASIQISHEDVK